MMMPIMQLWMDGTLLVYGMFCTQHRTKYTGGYEMMMPIMQLWMEGTLLVYGMLCMQPIVRNSP